MNTGKYYNKPSVTALSKVSVAGQQALSLLIVVIIILLLSGSGRRLRWHG